MIEWHTDHAATGLRERAFVGDWELIAYYDGRWSVCVAGVVLAHGAEPSLVLAQGRAIHVHAACTARVRIDSGKPSFEVADIQYEPMAVPFMEAMRDFSYSKTRK